MKKMSFFDKDVNAATQDILDKTGKTAAFGIDLGTTNSAIALVPSGTKPKIVPLKHGTTMPSCIMWTGKDKEFIVGKDAYEHRYESSCIYSVKRHMPEVDCHLTMTVGDKELTMTPAEISAEILKGLVKETKDLYGEVKDVVVTVPAKFNEIARQHTREACELAGLNLLGIIAEPTAASMCYDIEPDKGKTQDILVYDLGGGTFDVSLVRISAGDDMSKLYDVYGIPNSLRKADDSKIIRAIDGDGDPVLGGDDIDHDTYEVMLENLKADGVDVNRIDEIEQNRLILELENSKKRFMNCISIIHVVLDRGLPTEEVVDTKINHDVFVKGLAKTYEKSRVIVDSVLRRNRTNVSTIVLVGGSTKSSILKEALRADYPDYRINDAFPADEAVALGAGIHARFLKYKDNKINIFDNLITSIGVVQDDMVDVVIPRGSTFPVSKSKDFITSVDNQQAINVEIVQGNTKFVGDATPLGNLLIDNIPPGKSGEIIIKITLSINVRGLLACRVHISDLKSRFESIDRRIELDLSSVKGSSKKMSHEEKMVSRWRTLASKRGGEFGDTLNAMIDSGRSREEIMKFISDNCGGANGC